MKISVCIPTYNQSDFLEESVRSVMAQKLLPDEIIVSNDCSTDQTSEVLALLAAEFSILKVFNQPVNLGISRNTDFCLRAAQGEYIVRLDSDDLLAADYTQILSGLLDIFPLAGYAHAAVVEIDADSTKTNQRRLFRKTGFESADLALKRALAGYKVAANILIFRKSVLEEVGYIQYTQNFAEDFYLSVNIAKAGYGNIYCEQILACYRTWSDQAHVRSKRKLAEINGLNAVFNQAILPAFRERSWNTKGIALSKERFAIVHADCLGWKLYNTQEKLQLEQALLQLCATKKTRFFIWIYKNGFGSSIDFYQYFQVGMRRHVKKFLLGKTTL